MRNLEDFDVPLLSGDVSICEIDGRMQCMPFENANVSIFTTAVDKHPKIHIMRDSLHSTVVADEGRNLFLPVDMPFLKQLTQAYTEQGLEEALHTAHNHPQFLISGTASLIITVLGYLKKIKTIMNPTSHLSNSAIIEMYSQTRQWSTDSIRCIAWHPHGCKIAVATCDDSVRIYSSEGSFVPLLRCKQMKNVTCVAWRPYSNSEIAVAHENGILIWHVDPNSLVTRTSISNATVLERVDHRPVIDIAWSPKGDVLVSAAANNTKLLVWKVELNKTSTLARPGGLRNILVRWSPTGDKLFSATADKIFRVWNCRTWECERWTVLSGHVTAACWSACGSNLLFTTSNEPLIYGLTVHSEVVFRADTGMSDNRAVPLYDLTKVEVEGVTLGGLVQAMEMDPLGKHLAVLFKECDTVAVFGVEKAGLQLIASSLVVGLPEEKPSVIKFQQNFQSGACLTIGWSSGRVQYYPIVYTDLNEKSRNPDLNSFNSSRPI